MLVVGISGSLRQGSFNSALLRAAVGLAPEGVHIEIASIRGIPLYDGDVEAREGIPAAVRELKDRIAASDALLLSTPEYNRSIPGVFKNAIDWLSRPPEDIARVFGGRPVALMGATPGRGATKSARAAWLPVLRALGMLPFADDGLGVPRAREVFDDQGELLDASVRTGLESFLKGFADFVGAPRPEAGAM
jgi:chromate reductase, NAD(P)H dehydrogenase (quinone)